MSIQQAGLGECLACVLLAPYIGRQSKREREREALQPSRKKKKSLVITYVKRPCVFIPGRHSLFLSFSHPLSFSLFFFRPLWLDDGYLAVCTALWCWPTTSQLGNFLLLEFLGVGPCSYTALAHSTSNQQMVNIYL